VDYWPQGGEKACCDGWKIMQIKHASTRNQTILNAADVSS
jgi:hypothetical protein